MAQGAEVVSGHWTALHRWVWHDCQVHSNLSAGLVVIWMQVKLPSGTGAVTDTMFPPSLIKARMLEAVPWTWDATARLKLAEPAELSHFEPSRAIKLAHNQNGLGSAHELAQPG